MGYGWKPPKKTIENILYYNRKNKTGLDTLELLDKFVEQSQNIIFPINRDDYPTAAFDKGNPVVIVMKTKEKTLGEFAKYSKTKPFVWGLDSQYCNNNARFPVTILCAQDDKHRTVPGFIALSLKADEQHYSIILEQVLQFMEFNFKIIRSDCYVMIDKCCSERNAIKNCGVKFLLCQFHILRTISAKITKSFQDPALRVKCKTVLFFLLF